ncbi:bifunctional fructose-2,6-bisphosphate 2-phosphatase/6-phosphofructo-2-kinase, partial [Ascoidea rubescens DSM 1968]
DKIHHIESPYKVSPAQLYSTSSGRLFHAGKLLICLCGLPGRGKTHLSVSLTRYLRWLGVPTQSFHIDDYRRNEKKLLNIDYISNEFFNQSNSNIKNSEIKLFKLKIIENCNNDILNFFNNDNGQVAIYDAINGSASSRILLQKKFNDNDIKVLFIESLILDKQLLKNNLKVALTSPDYKNWDISLAKIDFQNKLKQSAEEYQEINSNVLYDENQLMSYIKFINFGERLIMNNSQSGYIINRIVFFLLNSRIKSGNIYFARCSTNDDTTDKNYSDNLSKTLVSHILKKKQKLSVSDLPQNLTVWCSHATTSVQTANSFSTNYNIPIVERTQLARLNTGSTENLSNEQIKKEFPLEYHNYKVDPYHTRYPRSESYHDVSVRIEPLILQIERITQDILIIAHESVLRVLYGYLMTSSTNDIPFFKFPQDEILEISYNAYSNSVKKIKI